MDLPKLTDDAVSGLPLEAGRAELLEEIMSTVAPDRQTDDAVPARAHRRARWLVPVAVAATVAAVASTPVWLHQDHDRVADTPFRAAPDSPGTGYRAILTAPGWKVTATEEEQDSGFGEVDYKSGGQELEITWYPASSYQSYLEDRQHISSATTADPGTAVTVLGQPGHQWAYDDHDHTVMREPDQGHWMELRGSGMDLAAYEALLGQLRLVSLAEFESALPSKFVSSADRPAAVQAILDGIEQVTGTTVPAGTTLDLSSGQSDPYQLGAAIAGQYACAWIAEFDAAKTAGDQAREDEAVRVMGTSRQWPVLQQMDTSGDYPEVVWQYADDLAEGQVPEGYVDGLGCTS